MRETETNRQTNRQTEIRRDSDKFTEKDGRTGMREIETNRLTNK